MEIKLHIDYAETMALCPSPSDDLISFASAFRQAAEFLEEQFQGKATIIVTPKPAGELEVNTSVANKVKSAVMDSLYPDSGGLWLFDAEGLENAAVRLLPDILP